MFQKKICAGLFAALLATGSIQAAPRVAVDDFTVTSDDPRLKYVGKGLTEMFSTQLEQSKAVILVDRAKRDALLGEAEFALSGAVDEQGAVQAGKLLSVNYLFFGEIVDMAGSILVNLSMVNVETGEVAWSDKSLGKLSDYDAITKRLAASALKDLGAQSAAVAVVAAKPKAKVVSEDKKVQAIFAFSEAVDAVDKKDTATAKRQIAVAKAIDPTNAAVAVYAARLAGASPRFLIELEKQAPTYNPATLGFLEKGQAYLWFSSSSPDEGNHKGGYPTSDPRYLVKETQINSHPGILLPLGENMGLMAEASFNGSLDFLESASHTNVTSTPSSSNLDFSELGGTIGFGIRLIDGFSLGLGAFADWLRATDNSDGSPDAYHAYYNLGLANKLYISAAFGLAYKSPDGALSLDTEAIWSNQRELYFSPPTAPLVTGDLVTGTLPLLASIGATLGLFDQRVFVSAKAISELYDDSRTGFTLRAIPGVEAWPLRWLAIRGAYEYSTLNIDDVTESGSGFMAGGSVVLGAFDLNFNWVNRFRPNRILPGTGRNTNSFMVGLVWNGLSAR
jgi:TolB-like protein